MPSVLSDEDKETVRRQVPKPSNKIQAVAVARLYIAYPNRSRWTYTGLQGAVVLANDLVGNTYWLKLVDISPQNRGVIWDQEIYETWSYNQDRTFFHTFETEECLAGLSFVDEKEAKTFFIKMNDREKNAHKATKVNPFGGASRQAGDSRKYGLFGGLFGGHRHSSPAGQPIPPEGHSLPPNGSSKMPGDSLSGGNSQFEALDAIDPKWRESWGEDLKQMGITDDLIRENQNFIAEYIKKQQGSLHVASPNGIENQNVRAPPPPPPATGARIRLDSPQSVVVSRGRAAPPAPPPARRSAAKVESPRDLSPPRCPPPPRFAAPPPLPDAGKFAHLRNQPRSRVQNSTLPNPGPPPPPRPPKTLADDSYEPGESGSRFGVPPPAMGERSVGPASTSNRGPHLTPSRGPVPPPPPARDISASQNSNTISPGLVPPPPLPPKTPNAPTTGAPSLPPTSTRPIPPALSRGNDSPPLPQLNVPPTPPIPQPSAPSLPPVSQSDPSPPPLPQSNAPPPPLPQSNAPPPPLPQSNAPAPPAIPSLDGPPAPPIPSMNAPPPPPMPNRDSGYASGVPILPNPSPNRSDLLAGIQKAGGIGALKKVDRSQIRDRSQAMVPGTMDIGPSGNGIPAAGPSGADGMAGALAAALNQRKKKVSASDDEADADEW